MTTKTETKTHTITFWLTITEDMLRFGYRELEPRFDKPYTLEDTDDCRVFEADIPEQYVIGPNKYGEPCLWDRDNNMSFVTAVVNKPETRISLYPIDRHPKYGPIGSYPIRFVRAQH